MPSSPLGPWMSGKATSISDRTDSACGRASSPSAPLSASVFLKGAAGSVHLRLRLLGREPGAGLGDADGHHLEALPVDGRHHVLRRDDRHLVLAGAPAEDDAESQLAAALRRHRRSSPTNATSGSSLMANSVLHPLLRQLDQRHHVGGRRAGRRSG